MKRADNGRVCEVLLTGMFAAAGTLFSVSQRAQNLGKVCLHIYYREFHAIIIGIVYVGLFSDSCFVLCSHRGIVLTSGMR